ncbi:MAG TPA: exodeoxyribonuclease VII small subunit [Candidatus Saccharimonadales bacterium]|jgi:exodeoxyribonuclease VII small subunit
MSTKSIAEQLDELDAIVARFDTDDLDVDAAIAEFERGEKLSHEIGTRLAEAKAKITVLKERFDQV